MNIGIDVRNLTCRFGTHTAVDDLSFSLEPGDILGFLGPNGAGKSTTMKMITGYLPPTSGQIRVAGIDITRTSVEAKRRIGYLPEGAPLYPEMTPASFLDFIGSIRGLKGESKRRRIDEVAQRIGLGEVWHQSIDTLSKGFKRRVGLAQAILHDPEILILDEPTDGLDPNQKHEVRQLVREMAPDKTIIISTHILEEVHALCSRVMLIARGRLVADDTPEGLRLRSRHHGAFSLTTTAEEAPALAEALRALPEVRAVDRADEAADVRLTAYPATEQPLVPAVRALLGDSRWNVTGFKTQEGQLDEVFRELTADGGAS